MALALRAVAARPGLDPGRSRLQFCKRSPDRRFTASGTTNPKWFTKLVDRVARRRCGKTHTDPRARLSSPRANTRLLQMQFACLSPSWPTFDAADKTKAAVQDRNRRAKSIRWQRRARTPSTRSRGVPGSSRIAHASGAGLSSSAKEIWLQWSSPFSVVLLTKTTDWRGAFRQRPKSRFEETALRWGAPRLSLSPAASRGCCASAGWRGSTARSR